MTDHDYMRQCLQLAEQGTGNTAPNPMVGAVLVHNGRIIASGYHHHYGGDHAEVNCLNAVAQADKHLVPQCTMYVSLEPCAHWGNTPPCAARLVQERVREVVIANTDPFALVSGRGIAMMQAAGIAVRHGLLQPEGLWLNRRFFCAHSLQRPYIILKWAETPEGFIAPASGSRLQITGPEAQQLVHQWRTAEGAIMVGTNTARSDNPRLTARPAHGRQPLRIALDRRLTLPRTHHLFDEAAATWIINEQQEIYSGNVHAIKLPFGDELLPVLLGRLHQARILSLIVEGGAQLLNSFIAAGLWDEARIFTGATSLQQGIAAPARPGSAPVITRNYGPDLLQIYVNPASAYPYVAGMNL